MDNLPEELIAHVLTFLPVSCKFSCQSVSKRWNIACDRAIMRNQSLILSNMSARESVIADMDRIFLSREMPMSPETTILRMKYLKNLVIGFLMDCCISNQILYPLIINNANTLTFLDIGYNDLPIATRFLTFPCLRKLHCKTLSFVETRRSQTFPRLTHLKLSKQNNLTLFPGLPRCTITSLACDFLVDQEVSVSDWQTFVTGVSRLTNLTHLSLDRVRVRQLDVHPRFNYDHLFDNFTRLEKLVIVFPHIETNTDVVMGKIVRNNPNLREIKLTFANVDDHSMGTLARLANLKSISLIQRYHVTTSAMMSLLRGASRSMINDINVSATCEHELGEEEIVNELSSIARERDCRFWTAGLALDSVKRSAVVISFG